MECNAKLHIYFGDNALHSEHVFLALLIINSNTQDNKLQVILHFSRDLAALDWSVSTGSQCAKYLYVKKNHKQYGSGFF